MALLPPSAHRHRLSGGARRSVRGRRDSWMRALPSLALGCFPECDRDVQHRALLSLAVILTQQRFWRSRICWRHHSMIAYGRPGAILCRASPRRRPSSWLQLGIGQSQEPQAQPT
ncbi:hypothetical protein GY45DRAFT_675328 [Cubamyces sp. BRFM 1775]|nr:hypothetical protein GY45DRAFT_675328 [Cubamyces sp. BRFM 1775]